MLVLGCVLVALVCSNTRAAAQGRPEGQPQPAPSLGDPALTADPNAPMFAYGWLGGARGHLSLDIPIPVPESFGGSYLSLRPIGALHYEEGLPSAGPEFLPLAYTGIS